MCSVEFPVKDKGPSFLFKEQPGAHALFGHAPVTGIYKEIWRDNEVPGTKGTDLGGLVHE